MTTKRGVEPGQWEIPGPAGYPLVGVLPKAWRSPLQFFLNSAIEYGPVVRLAFGSRSLYLVNGPDEVKRVLQENNRNYRKGYDQAKPLMGEGLVTSEGEFWRSQRRLIQPMFNHDHIDSFSTHMLQATEEMLQRWEQSAQNGATLVMADEMMRLTQTIIVRTMFSGDVGDQAYALGAALDTALEYLNRVLFSPSPLLTRLPTPSNRRHQRALAFLNDYIYSLIASKRASQQDTGDLLSLLVFAKDEENRGMPDQQIRDELMTIFLAGHETTANALAWTWYLLSENPQVEQQLIEEIDQVLGGRPPAMEDLKQFRYLPMVINEVLRMFPPAWLFARHAIEEDTLGGCQIPAGAMLFLSPYVTHRLPQHWENPAVFDPQRFLPERAAGRHKFAYFPFGGGPRLCIGNQFALTEAQLIVVRVLQQYRLRLSSGAKVRPTPVATLQPRPGVPITLIPR